MRSAPSAMPEWDAPSGGLFERGADVTVAETAVAESAATARAIALLSRREHARNELVRKLIAKGTLAEVADRVVESLASRGYQSDLRFADMLARTRIGDSCGPLRIAADLRSAGVDGAVAATATMSALDYHCVDWMDVAREALRRRGLTPPLDLAGQRKAYALLQRRGFDGETIRAALRQQPENS